jgi:hypothetical protein
MKMPTPAKPKKTRRNQPVVFKETLTPVLPTAPAIPSLPAAPALPAISTRALQVILVIVWIAAAIAGGIGIGRLIIATTTHPRALPGLPVARAAVGVAPLPAAAAVLPVRPVAPTSSLAVAPAGSAQQAQAGTPFATAGSNWSQAAGPDVQPGFASFGQVQGNIGTTPVY